MTTLRRAGAATLVATLAACAGVPATPPAGTRAALTLMETTDLHQSVLGYDYYKLAPDESVGLDRTATLIRRVRASDANTMLFDAGDLLQGTVLGDYQAVVHRLPCSDELAIFKAMDAIGYDAGTIGNHEFNYGLGYLAQVTGHRFDVPGLPPVAEQPRCAGPAFPQVLANVVSASSGRTIFDPYVILSRTFSATTPDGRTVRVPVKVGVIGFTPPTIMSWDKGHLEGRVTTLGLREAAERYVPEMKARGADIVVAIDHGGPDGAAYSPTMENGALYLAQVPGIDVLLMGHMHQVFPDPASKLAAFDAPGVDKVAGRVAGVPAVMADFWGKTLGVVRLQLVAGADGWHVDKAATTASTLSTRNADKTYVPADPAIAPLVQAEHAGTIAYVKTPIGTSDFRMSSYFADVGDVTALQVVNQAQAAYVKRYVDANLPQYRALPVLSASAPFKSGFGGAGDYTDVAAGDVAIFNAADLYLFANTLQAVLVSGDDVKAWLEMSASRFNRIDPARTDAQALVGSYPAYNFDVLGGDGALRYEIDVTRPQGDRIRHLTYAGRPLDPAAQFIVATNSYRANGGGGFPGLDGHRTILASPDANREALIAYVKAAGHLSRAANGADRPWRFTPVRTAGPVEFSSAPGLAALAAADGVAGVTQVQADDGGGHGLARYRIDLGVR